jgi:hypothetical protein
MDFCESLAFTNHVEGVLVERLSKERANAIDQPLLIDLDL